MKWLKKEILAFSGLFLLVAFISACGGDKPTPTPTPTNVSSPIPTFTPTPTLQGTSSPTPSPTATQPTPTPTPLPQELFLLVLSPLDNSVVNTSEIPVSGITSPDATVSVNGQLVTPGPDGIFTTSMTLEVGPNLIEIIATDLTGNQADEVLTIIYIAS